MLYVPFTTPGKKAGSAQTGAGAARTASARPYASAPAVKANAAVGKAGEDVPFVVELRRRSR